MWLLSQPTDVWEAPRMHVTLCNTLEKLTATHCMNSSGVRQRRLRAMDSKTKIPYEIAVCSPQFNDSLDSQAEPAWNAFLFRDLHGSELRASSASHSGLLLRRSGPCSGPRTARVELRVRVLTRPLSKQPATVTKHWFWPQSQTCPPCARAKQTLFADVAPCTRS